MSESSGTQVSIEELRKSCIKELSQASVEYYEMFDALDRVSAEYNAFSREERLTNPAACALFLQWKNLDYYRKLKGIRLYGIKMNLVACTGGNIDLWPRHLKRHHPSNDYSVIVDEVPVAKEAAAGEDTCFICLDNVPDAKFNECGHSGVCCKCADSVIRRGMACPLCRADVFDFTVTE